MKLRLSILILLALCCLCFILLKTDRNKGKLEISWEVLSEPPYHFGIIPYLTDPELKLEYEPLLEFLTNHLKRKVKLYVAPDYQTLGRLMNYGKVHFAWFSNASYESLNKDNAWEILCRPIRNGMVVHRGCILVRSDSGIKNIFQLKGKKFGYVDRNSGTGYFYANEIFVANGIKPLSFFGSVDFSGNHTTSLERLRSGEYDGIATLDVFNTPGFLKPEEIASYTVLAHTRWIKNDLLVVLKQLDPKLKESVRNLFVNMENFAGGREVIQHLNKIRRWEKFVSEDVVEKMISELDLEPK